MGYLKRNRSMWLVLIGTLLMATSIFWEYVRMRPDYLRIVSPWTQRGYDLTQGLVIAAIKYVRLLTGWNLKQAKECVDRPGEALVVAARYTPNREQLLPVLKAAVGRRAYARD